MAGGRQISHGWMALATLVFLAKALILSFWLTPLWDVPDENGHFHYARSLGSGQGMPVLGQDRIDPDIMSHLHRRATDTGPYNWIAQHPPLYYVIAGGAWRVASWVTDDPEILFRAPRVVSALAGALVLLVCYRLMLLVHRDRLSALAFASLAGFIPMFSHMSSGTNHDTLLTLLCALAILSWSKFLLVEQKPRYVYMAAFWLSLAFFTKMTALVLAVPMLAVLFYEYRGSWWSRAKIVLTSCAIYLPLPALWMIWNQFHHGMLLPVRADVLPSGYRLEENPLSESMLTFLSGHPVLEHFFINFIGMFGFGGTGGGSLKVLQVVSWQLGVYSLLALGLAVAVFAFLVLWLKRCIESPSGAGSSSVADRVVMACRPLTSRRIFFWLSLLAAVLSAVFVATQMGKTATPGGELRMVFYGFLTALLVLAVASRLKPGGEQLGVVAYAVLIMSFFMAVFLYQLWGVYLQDGRMRATQGRYLFPLIPLMLLAAYIPLVHFFKKRKAGLVVALALIMSLLEASVYLTQAFPFYEKGLA